MPSDPIQPDTEQNENSSKHAPKRTAAQRAADLKFAEHHHLRGKTHASIAELLSAERGYTISRQQVAYDIKSLEKEWAADAAAMIANAKARTLKTMTVLELAAWEGWDASRTLAALFRNHEEATKARRSFPSRGSGDPAFLKIMLEVHDRRERLLGLNAAAKPAGPHGAVQQFEEPALTDELQEALLQRFYERSLKKKYAAEHGLSVYSLEMQPVTFIERGKSQQGAANEQPLTP